MACFNDLIGLRYQWAAEPVDGSGFTDCFGLSMEIRKRLGLHDFRKDFSWIYDGYNEHSLTAKQILRWVWKHGERTTIARPGALFATKGASGTGLALATVIDDSLALLIGPSGRVIALPFAKVAKGKFYWAD